METRGSWISGKSSQGEMVSARPGEHLLPGLTTLAPRPATLPLKDLELTERMLIFCLICHSSCPPGHVICSEKCFETLIQRLEQKFGTHIKVVDLKTMKAYSVPLRDIVEGGLKQKNLKYFSEWK